MVTTRSKGKASPPPDSGDAVAGSKRGVPSGRNKAPPSKQRKQTGKDTKGKDTKGKNTKEEEPDVKTGEPEAKPDTVESGDDGISPPREENKTKPADAETGAIHKDDLPKAVPGTETTTVHEKGLIYFFSRPRVSVEDPKSVSDLARSFFVLRPADGDKKPPEDGPCRLCVIPKKVLPTSGRERWIGFVEKAGEPWYKATGGDLEEKEYETKTAGRRHVPGAIAVAEGIYALTRSDRAASLVYIVTEPEELGEVQRELGLKERGYFTISTRNPVYPAPKGMGVPGKPEYPQEIMQDFQSLRWIPTQPRHLDHPNAQFLLVGHSAGIEEAFKPDTKGAEKEKKPAEDEIMIKEELLEGEEDLMYNIKEDEVADVLLDLEKYSHDMKVETEF